MTVLSSYNEVKQSHKWSSGFLGGLVPFAAAKNNQEVAAASGTWHVQGCPRLRAAFHKHVLVWQEQLTTMVIHSQVILEVYRAQ